MASNEEGKNDNVEVKVIDVVESNKAEGSESSFETALKQVSEHFALKRRNWDKNVSEIRVGGSPSNECVVEDGLEGLSDIDDDDCAYASEEESYLADSDSADTDESVETEYEVAYSDQNGSDGQDFGGADTDGEDFGGADRYIEIPKEIRGGGGSGSGSDPFFALGMSFGDKKELRMALDKYAITHGVNIKIARSNKRMLQAVCQPGCRFVLYASMTGEEVGFVVKTLLLEHNCARAYKNQRASARWLAEEYKEKIQDMPQFKISEMKLEVERERMVNVSIHKCKRAKRKIMQEMEGSYKDEFANLEAYCNELKISNPGSDVIVELNDEALELGRRVFRRMYVCFNASKVGWSVGCRPLISVDGTFLKGKAKGVLLTAVGMDANQSLYPIAFGLVEKENGVHWCWFIELLRKSLHLGTGSTVTMMSDMQKGLSNAIRDVLPDAEHRLCARHIYMNWSKKWAGPELRNKFWACAWSTFEEEFRENLMALAKKSRPAARAAMNYSTQAWVRAYFTPRCKSWVVDNNKSECLNSWIDEYMYHPVIRMFDGIRTKMMAKWANSENKVRRWKTNYSPKCMELFDANRYLAGKCRVQFNGDEGYEVREGIDRHTVSLKKERCTCRAWDLTGIPCQHAICAMLDAQIEPTTLISKYYHKETYLASYKTKLQPVRGKQFWNISNFLPMQPPPTCTLPGRPKVKRIRTEESNRRVRKGVAVQKAALRGQEPQTVPDKLPTHGKKQRCSLCRKEGHYRSTCKEAPSSSTSQPPRKTKHAPSNTHEPARKSKRGIMNPSSSTTHEASQSTASQPPIATQESRNIGNPSHQTPSDPYQLKYKHVYTRRMASGHGVLFDEATGSMVYNPGLSSEIVIQEGSASQHMLQHGDTRKTFPIPNEKDMRMRRGQCSNAAEGERRIQFKPQGKEATMSLDLPIQPPCLQWKGSPSVTTRQLLAKRDNMASKTRAGAEKPSI